MPFRRAAADVQPTGQHPGAFQRRVLALFHDVVDVHQPGVDFLPGAPGFLVGEHDLGDRLAGLGAVVQQLRGGGERVGLGLDLFLEVFLDPFLGAVLDDEPPPTE